MNEKLCEQILEYMKATGDFILSEMPEVAQQAIEYHWKKSIFSLILIIIIILLCSVCIYFVSQRVPNERYDDIKFFGYFVPSMLIFLFSMFGCCAIDKMIKIAYAPKYFIIELFTKGEK